MTPRATRRAQLVADAVSVLCPMCSEPQPNPSDGSEQWTHEDFVKVRAHYRCVSCESPLIIASDTKVAFQ